MQKFKNILRYQGIGEVYYIKNDKARNLSIRINQQGEVRVTVPRFVSMNRAERFFLSKRHWVMKRLNELSDRDCKAAMPVEGGSIVVRGQEHPVQLMNGEENVEAAIWRVLQREALNYLPGRVKELSEKHGYTVSGIKIRKMRTRWGSCTAKGGINLNCWLMIVPEYLSDYVILHELVHTRIHNHGADFWKELDLVTAGSAKKYRKELQDRRIMCFGETPPYQ